MAEIFFFLAACGGLFVAWHKGSKAVRVAPPSANLNAFVNQIESELGPLVKSKSLSVALLDDGKVVHNWRLTIRGGRKNLNRVVAKVRKAARRAEVRLIAVSKLGPTEEVSLLLIPSRAERCMFVLRPSPSDSGRRFALALIVEPKSIETGRLDPLAGVHLPLTFLLDLRLPGASEVARWLSEQGYEVAARGILHPSKLSPPFSGLLVERVPSPELVKEATKRSFYLILPRGQSLKEATTVSLDVKVEGDSFVLREGLSKLFNLAKRKGRAVGLVRLSADVEEVAILVEILREWVITEGIVLKTVGEVAKGTSQLERQG